MLWANVKKDFQNSNVLCYTKNVKYNHFESMR